MPEPLALRLAGVDKAYLSSARRVPVLSALEVELARGQRMAIMGDSGSGKTTLLNLAALIDRPDCGRIELFGQDVTLLPEPARTRLRARYVGLIFQDFNLMDTLTVAENIELPLWLARLDRRRERVRAVAHELGVADCLDERPGLLSGGQQQRVAIARALVHAPALLLADEPTGSLDQATGQRVLALLRAVTAERAVSLILVTHSRAAAGICDTVLRLSGGRLHPV